MALSVGVSHSENLKLNRLFLLSSGLRTPLPHLPTDANRPRLRDHGGRAQRGRLQTGHKTALQTRRRSAVSVQETDRPGPRLLHAVQLPGHAGAYTKH